MQLTPHFTLEEMTYSDTAKRCGIDNSAPTDIIDQLELTCQMLEIVRAALGNKPIYVSSGYRCPALNAAIGGSINSQHMTGQACDFTMPDFGTPHQVCKAIMAIKPPIRYDQLIWEYGDWIHISQASDPRMMALTINNSGTQSGIA